MALRSLRALVLHRQSCLNNTIDSVRRYGHG
eukprot:CAMPEP_0201727346 /NCGR_PEP_ID=MMETSP0593-20130828/11928_1 /ASSEMBLY_ACC=CAM_ASM_000672 /TAXON_ID=267983 /ORGANISM="Skeletonema japonicum, Strain CCMP2506" /LENGTH=30 /DNA_ID= /DNA_START= /DNA_END= /DNA_ORIENTATION=